MHLDKWLERLATRSGMPRGKVLSALKQLAPVALSVFTPLPGEAAAGRGGRHCRANVRAGRPVAFGSEQTADRSSTALHRAGQPARGWSGPLEAIANHSFGCGTSSPRSRGLRRASSGSADDSPTRPLESAVWAALHDVHDPEIPTISVVDLGVVRTVETEAGSVRVELLPTFVGCPAIEVMRSAVEERLRDFADDVSVDISFSEPWTSERITPEGRRVLRDSGFAPPATCAGGERVVDSACSAGRTMPILRLAQHDTGERVRANCVSRDLSLR